MVQNTEVRVGEQICKTCKESKSINKYYKRANKKPEIHCRSCRNKKRDENHRYWKQQFMHQKQCQN